MEDDGYTHEEKNFAAEVAKERRERGWTLAEMAEKLERAGVPSTSVMSVSRVENGKRHVSMIEAQAYSNILKRSVSSLMHPDGRESLLRLFMTGEGSGRRAYVALKDAARDFGEHQAIMSANIPAILDLYPDEDSVPVDLRSTLDNYLLNARQFVSIDAAEEVRQIVKKAWERHGQHPTAP